MIEIIYIEKEKSQEIIEYIKSTSQKETSDVTYKEALCSEKYMKATWIGVVLMIFHELAGSNLILIYSNQIFQDLNK